VTFVPAIRHPYGRHVARKMLQNKNKNKNNNNNNNNNTNAFPWLCKKEMRFLSTTPWLQSKLPLQP